MSFLVDPPHNPDGLAIGSQVIVQRNPDHVPGPWPAEPTGRTVAYPDGSAWADISTLQGQERSSWVHFDEPQRDPDGDAPYRGAEVLERT